MGGASIIRAARIRDLASGGQVFVSGATAAVVAGAVPDGVSLVEVGDLELKGFDQPESVFWLRHRDLPEASRPVFSKSRLPAYSTDFVGRQRELDEIADLIGSGGLVTITGAGGSGKTRLAHATASRAGKQYGAGVAWVDLAKESEPDQVASAALAACRLAESTEWASADLLARHLARRPTLLVVDNCEHLLPAVADLLATVLQAGPCGPIVATSREPLGVAGEVTWRIPSLDLPEVAASDPEATRACDAVQLFARRAKAADPAFELTADNGATVVRVCRRLDGIPLALELAAARTRTMSIQDLADRLDDRFSLLTTGSRGGLERQRTLQASVQWSYDLLDEDEERLLRSLSVFVAPFRLEAAEAVGSGDELGLAEVFDVLARLVDKSLVQHHGGRYSMLETIRAFAEDRAVEAGELGELRDRHLGWAIRRVRSWGFPHHLSANLDFDDQLATAPDLFAAIEWAWGDQPEHIPLLVQPLPNVLTRTGALGKARLVVERAGREVEEGSPLWCEIVAPLAYLLSMGGYLDWIEPARVALAENPSLDPALIGLLRFGWAILDVYSGEATALDELERAAEECERAGDDLQATLIMANEAFALAAMGQTRRARSRLERFDQHDGDPRAWWMFELVRAHVAAADGDCPTAVRIVEPLLDQFNSTPCISASYFALHYGDKALARRVDDLVSDRTFDGWLQVVETLPATVLAILDHDWASAADLLARAQPDLVDNYLYSQARLAEIELHLHGPDIAGNRLAVLEPPTGDPRLIMEFEPALDLVASLVAASRDDGRKALALAVEALAKTRQMDYLIGTVPALYAVATALDRVEPGSSDAALWLGAADVASESTGIGWRGPVLEEAVTELRSRVDEHSYTLGRETPIADCADMALTTLSPQQRPAVGWDALTPAESRVVALVGQGLSNREVADALYVSISTVKTHLVHAYQKLDVNTRPALAAAAATRSTAKEAQ